MATLPETEPLSFVQGNLIEWTKDLSGINDPASDEAITPDNGWALTYEFVIEGDHQQVTTSDNGDESFKASISTTASALFSEGIYAWRAYASKGSARYLVDEGKTEVFVDFATQTTGYDHRSHFKTVIDALESTLEGKASLDQLSYSIAGRSLSRMSPEDLVDWLSKYRRWYAEEQQREAIADGRSPGNVALVRFIDA